MSKGKKAAIAVAVSVLVLFAAALAYILCFGIKDYYGDTEIVYVEGLIENREKNKNAKTFSASFSLNTFPDDSEKENLKEIIASRLKADNITGYHIEFDENSSVLKVSYPVYGDTSEFDPQNTAEKLSATNLISFCRGDDKTDIILSGSDDIKSAAAAVDAENGPVVQLTFTEQGKRKFAAATAEMIGQIISIWIDDTMISAPTVNQAITDGNAIITGMGTTDDATELAKLINAGELPFALELLSADIG